MCEFCTKHGEGKKWYLRAENYSQELLTDAKRRGFLEGYFTRMVKEAPKMLRDLEGISRWGPILRPFILRFLRNRTKKIHFGQVVPIEDVEQILEITNSVIRLPCMCRRALSGKDVRCCLAVSVDPKALGVAQFAGEGFQGGPDSAGLEWMERGEAVAFLRELYSSGIVHTVWSFSAPFIGLLCNCDAPACLAFQTLRRGLQVMFRAEYVAEIDPSRCVACGTCAAMCPFDAVEYRPGAPSASIRTRRCYGCGACRATCEGGAIVLRPRTEVPAAARLW